MTDPLLQKLEQLVLEIDQLIPLLDFVPEDVLTQPTPVEPSALELLLDTSRVDAEALAALSPETTLALPPLPDRVETVLAYVRSARMSLVNATREIGDDIPPAARRSVEAAIAGSTETLRRIGLRILESKV